MKTRLAFRFLTTILIFGLLLGAASVQADEPHKIMLLGNSITYDNFFGDTRPASLRTGYRSHLWHLLIDSGYNVDFVGSVVAGQNVLPLFDPDNEGWPGWTAAQIASNVVTFLENNPPDSVLLHIGTNGLTANTSDVANILNAIDSYEISSGRQVLVILALIINRSCITATPPCAESETTTAFNDALYTLAQQRISSGDNLVVIDMEEGAGLDYRLAPIGNMVDNLHPADSGYALMADLAYDLLQTILPVPTEPLPFVDILAPASGSFVEVPFNIEFQTGNWLLAQGASHVRLLIDGQDQGAYYSTDPIAVSALGPGSHIVKLVLANADGTLTNFFDGIVVTNNLAVNRVVSASSVELSGFEALLAVDGSSTTRWSSAFTDNQWIQVDLGSVRTIGRVILDWETAYGLRYAIQVSTNGTDWTAAYTETNGNGGTDDIILVSPVTARYVRMQGIQRATRWGYSLFEFEVYGESSVQPPELTTIAVSPSVATVAVGAQEVFTASGFDQYGNPFPVSATWSVSGGGSIDTQGRFTAATVGGPFTVEAQDGGIVGTAMVTVADSLVNLALSRPAVASSAESVGVEASRAVDGSLNTRWSSAFTDNQWIQVDLGSVRTIGRVILDWETAYGLRYAIQVSTNGTVWSPAYTETNGNGGTDDIILVSPVTARYVRMQGIQRATRWGYSLFEFEVYGESSVQPPELTTIAVSPSVATVAVGAQEVFTASGFDQYGNPFPVSATWSVSGGGSIDTQGRFTAATVGGPFTVEAQDGGIVGTAMVTVADSLVNLALSRPAVASSAESVGVEASRAVDGSLNTRWSSAFTDNQWIQVDLGSVRTIGRVILDWETAYGLRYAIQVSTNGTVWSPAYTETNGNGGTDDIILVSPVTARYVRMQGIQRATRWGYSLFEFEVYGESSVQPPELTTIAVSPSVATVAVGAQEVFTASGFDQYGNPFPVSATWSVSGGGSIDTQGRFTAATVGGPFTVEAQDGGIVGTAMVTVADSLVNLALSRPAAASSAESVGVEASRAVDGSLNTRWSSAFTDNQWIQVDLGSVRTIGRVILDWETAYGLRYAIQVSTNGTVWSPAYTETNGNGGTDDIILVSPVTARYVRMQGIQRATRWGYSLFEFEVYE